MKLCRVKKGGLFTTVQDSGRYGFQRFGVPVSGAMDTHAFLAANLLVGNSPNDACLEITLLGPELEFLTEAQIAITGASLSPTINGEEVACWQTLTIHERDVLSFDRALSGCRTYFAVRGGIDVPAILSSRSTYVSGRFGGLNGRRLRKGDVIEMFRPESALTPGLRMPTEFIPSYSNDLSVEVILGPQSDHFAKEGEQTFLSSIYTITTNSDRMGYRLDGPTIKRTRTFELISSGVPVGAVQVPRDGHPIVVMKDGQTTGGYPKIGVVTTPHISSLAQAKPMDKIRFMKTTLENARTKVLEHMKALNAMKKSLRPNP